MIELGPRKPPPWVAKPLAKNSPYRSSEFQEEYNKISRELYYTELELKDANSELKDMRAKLRYLLACHGGMIQRTVSIFFIFGMATVCTAITLFKFLGTLGVF